MLARDLEGPEWLERFGFLIKNSLRSLVGDKGKPLGQCPPAAGVACLFMTRKFHCMEKQLVVGPESCSISIQN